MQQKNDAIRILTPSWVVNFVALTTAILVAGAAIILSQYRGSELSRQIFEIQQQGRVSNSTYDSITTNISNNSFLNALPLLLVWAAVGLVVYYFALAFVRSIGRAVELRDELDYVNVSREDRLRQALKNLILRALVLIAWFMFFQITLHVLVPYALAAANIAARSLSLQSAAYGLLSIVIIYVTIWAHAIFLRLFMLRTRVFG